MSTEKGRSYRFKSFQLDVAERQLVKDGVPVSLTPKAFDVLVFLVERAGHLVEKEELMQAIWTDAFVEDASLTRNIHTLRKALGEDQNGNKFIATVAKKGYRFVAEVTLCEDLGNADPRVALVTEEHFPEFIYETDADNSPAPIARSAITELRHLRSVLWVSVGFLIAVALVAIVSFDLRPTSGPRSPVSIAVMPLRPLDTESKDGKLDLAVADSLVSQLSAAKGLRVLPLSATWQYLDTDRDSAAAGRELNVDYVLASNYQIAQGTVRVTTQLINVESGAVDDTFKSERTIAPAFQTQDLIAADVGGAIVRRFGVSGGDVVRRRGTENDEAHRLVLQAIYTVDNKKRGIAETESLALVEKALALDPNYARAYATRAHAYRRAAWDPSQRLGITSEDCYLKAKDAVETALRLDPDSSDAYVMLGEIKNTYEWKSDESEAAFRKAIELDPGSAHARRYFALFLMDMERFDESIEHAKSSIELEPVSVYGQRVLGQIYHRAGKYDEAIVQLKRVLEMDPNFREGSGMIWRSYYLKGDHDAAYREYRNNPRWTQADQERLVALDQAYSAGGWQAVFRLISGTFDKSADSSAQSSFGLSPVLVYVGLGEYDKAISFLEMRASDHNRAGVIFLGRWLDPLRPHPRFQALMRNLGYRPV